MMNLTKLNENDLIKIPLKPGSKLPKVTQWQTLRKTPAKELFANSNVGLLINKQFLVIDVDVKDDGLSVWSNWVKQYGEPLTPTQITPTGGKHYLFRYCSILEQKIIKLNVEGKSVDIDILFGSAYIVTEPSRINGKSYKWLKHYKETPLGDVPEWLLTKIVSHQESKKPTAVPMTKLSKPITTNLPTTMYSVSTSFTAWL